MLRTSTKIMVALALSIALPRAAGAGGVPSSTTITTTTTSTTTTLPPACADEASLDSVECRLDALLAQVGGADLGRFGVRLEKNLMRAARVLDRVEDECRDDELDKAKRQLKRVIRILVRGGRALRSLSARRSLDPSIRTELLGEVTDLVRDTKRLKRTLVCPIGSPSGAFV